MPNSRERIQNMLNDYRKKIPEPPRDAPPNICRAYKCIKRNLFSQKLAVGWVKSQCNVNGNNFSAKFKYYLGKPPQQFWLKHRIAAAKQLLSKKELTDTDLLEIALELGFRSHSAFSMRFKAYEASSPNAYRSKNH